MKKNILFLFGTLLMMVGAKAQPVASLILSESPVSVNLTHFTVTDPNNEPYTIQTTIGERACRQIPGSKYGYFHVSDVAVPSSESNLIFTITYYDAGTDELSFQYNATPVHLNYKNVGIRKTNTNEWITATIALTDASLRNAQNNGADFRIGTTTGYNNYIREITISTGTLNPELETAPITTGSSYSEFIGKSVTGYQVWFQTGTPTSGWFHWAGGAQPSPGHLTFELYPDVEEYLPQDLTKTGFSELGNGSTSQLFNSSNTSVINKHFDWMQTNGIDGVALQRFINGIGPVINNSSQASPLKVKEAAEATERVFYICYDISSSGLDESWDEIIKFDWVYNIEQTYALTSSPAYATVGNKPVVQIWGTGFDGGAHPGTEAETIALINFLKSRGCYVIGGVPTHWRTGTGDSKSGFMNAYKAYDMLSPWSVGRFGNLAEVTNFKNNHLIPDKNFTNAEGIAYMPVLFPGFSWSQWKNGLPNAIPRLSGDFLWQQALNIKELGVSNMYFAMLDEYDEATALMKMATDYSMIPTDQYFVTTSADGIWTSSDFYLRLAGAATEMLKGIRPVSSKVPVLYSEGPVYYRNSFEKRYATYEGGAGYFNIDPCFYNDVLVSIANVVSPQIMIEQEDMLARTGSFLSSITGIAAADAELFYLISETKILVKPDMHLSFWKYSADELGKYTSVDLLFKSGKRLSTLSQYVDQKGYPMHPGVDRGILATWEQYTCQIGVGELVGDTIVGVLLGYTHPSLTGTFTAYFDDILLEDAAVIPVVQLPYYDDAWTIPGKIEAAYYDLGGEGIAYHDVDAENKFHLYRIQEGVDLETTGDTEGTYNVGWIESGEWLEYTVDVKEVGIYNMEVRVASGNTGTKALAVLIEGDTIVANVGFETALGWQAYETISVLTPVLSEGRQIMRVYMKKGGFNLNYINFVLDTPIPTSSPQKNKEEHIGIVLSPNPVANGEEITLYGRDLYRYTHLRLLNTLGQSVVETSLTPAGNTIRWKIPEGVSEGGYNIVLTGEHVQPSVQKIFIR
jgi:hypothetical protein